VDDTDFQAEAEVDAAELILESYLAEVEVCVGGGGERGEGDAFGESVASNAWAVRQSCIGLSRSAIPPPLAMATGHHSAPQSPSGQHRGCRAPAGAAAECLSKPPPPNGSVHICDNPVCDRGGHGGCAAVVIPPPPPALHPNPPPPMASSLNGSTVFPLFLAFQVTGIFGMNLDSNVQEDEGWFKGVIICICVGIVVCVLIAFSCLQMFLRA
jgi:hypothetical protein